MISNKIESWDVKYSLNIALLVSQDLHIPNLQEGDFQLGLQDNCEDQNRHG